MSNGLGVGTHNSAFTVTGMAIGSDRSVYAAIGASFRVTRTGLNTAITIEPEEPDFGMIPFGYARPTPIQVTVTNTGNTSITLRQPIIHGQDATSWLITTDTNWENPLPTAELPDFVIPNSIPPNNSRTFYISPNPAGLPLGTHSPTIHINSECERVRATVRPRVIIEMEPSPLQTAIITHPERNNDRISPKNCLIKWNLVPGAISYTISLRNLTADPTSENAPQLHHEPIQNGATEFLIEQKHLNVGNRPTVFQVAIQAIASDNRVSWSIRRFVVLNDGKLVNDDDLDLCHCCNNGCPCRNDNCEGCDPQVIRGSANQYFAMNIGYPLGRRINDDFYIEDWSWNRIASGFGRRNTLSNLDLHSGFDIAGGNRVIRGTPILSATRGTVHRVYQGASPPPNNSTGYFIAIQAVERNPNNNEIIWSLRDPYTNEFLIFTYMHLRNRPTLTVGTIVEQGQLIGHVGDTDSIGSNHLHFEVSNYGGTDLFGSFTPNSLNARRKWYRTTRRINPRFFYDRDLFVAGDTQGNAVSIWCERRPPRP